MKNYALIIIIIFLFLTGCIFDPYYKLNPDNNLGEISNYVVYYSTGEADELSQFDLAIIQPDTLTPQELDTVRSAGTKVAAYLSIGEAEESRPWWDQVDPDWILDLNPNWDSYFIDTGQQGWQDLLLDVVVPGILELPFDGLFLDTLDTVDLYPETIPGMVSLVAALREAYPDLVLIQNRGFTVLEQTAPYIDSVMYECMNSEYNFDTELYERVYLYKKSRFVWNIASDHGLVVLALDYADPADQDTIAWCYEQAAEYLFVPYVATIRLDEIFLDQSKKTS